MDDKKKFDIIKLFKNKRYRALLILFLYLIFFTILFGMMDLSSTSHNYESSNNSNEEKNNFANISNYTFYNILTINEDNYIINGSRYNNKYQFSYLDKNYILTYEEIFEISDIDTNIINTFRFTPDILLTIIENSELISTKNIISSNEQIDEYSVLLKDYINLMDIDLDVLDEEKITIILSKVNDNVGYIEIDLSSFYKYINEDIYKYVLKFNYSNINNILEF